MSIQSVRTGYSGLAAAQLGMDTAANNVANANTIGYTRQRVGQSPSPARELIIGQVGTGVRVDDITRARDAFLDARLRGAVSSEASLETRAGLLGRAENILGEPEFGVSTALDNLFATFEDLSLDATDQARRLGVMASVSAVADRFNRITDGLSALRDDASNRVTATVESVNNLLAGIAELNTAISISESRGANPNDLLDRRDRSLDELATATGAQISTDASGFARVTLNGLSLVDGGRANSLSWDPATETLAHSGGSAVTSGGVIGGLQSFITSDITEIQSSIDALAVDLANAINVTNQAGFTAAGVAGGDLLTFDVAEPAGSLSIATTDPTAVAASDDGTAPFAVHNGQNARALADLRDTLSAGGGVLTLLGAARSVVTDVGSRTATTKQAASTQAQLATSAELSRAASQGVNIDEEMIELIKYQRAYEAAARVVTTADQALDTLINRTGIVGR